MSTLVERLGDYHRRIEHDLEVLKSATSKESRVATIRSMLLSAQTMADECDFALNIAPATI